MLRHILITVISIVILSRATKAAISLIPYGTCRWCQLIKHELDIEFHLLTRNNPTTPYFLLVGNETNLEKSPFDRNKETIFFIHGYSTSGFGNAAITLSSAYLGRSEYNFIVVNWEKLAAIPWYSQAVANTRIVGEYAATMARWLENRTMISISDLHVIGFSLGAHTAGFMAKNLFPRQLKRITGLDPAGPSFVNASENDRLNKFDAKFIDIIHTNSKLAGLEKPIGHVDFYVNNGMTQPGCIFPDFICSHRRAWFYYAESVLNEQGFPATRCLSWQPTEKNCTFDPENYSGFITNGIQKCGSFEPRITSCSKNLDAFMGFAVNHKTRGIFTLKTNGKSPFARNMTDFGNVVI